MSKKFEYVDDNPGSYFGMLVESVEDKKDTKKQKIFLINNIFCPYKNSIKLNIYYF